MTTHGLAERLAPPTDTGQVRSGKEQVVGWAPVTNPVPVVCVPVDDSRPGSLKPRAACFVVVSCAASKMIAGLTKV
jgi:hypothetical protein